MNLHNLNRPNFSNNLKPHSAVSLNSYAQIKWLTSNINIKQNIDKKKKKKRN